MVPLSPDFEHRHPELSRRRSRDASIRLPVLITSKSIAKKVDDLLVAYGGGRYGGFVDGWQPYGSSR